MVFTPPECKRVYFFDESIDPGIIMLKQFRLYLLMIIFKPSLLGIYFAESSMRFSQFFDRQVVIIHIKLYRSKQ